MRAGRQQEAFARGLMNETRQSGVADLLLLADVARLSGHPHEAVGPFERILDVCPRDAPAPLAALALGRLELDMLNVPARARRRPLHNRPLGLHRRCRRHPRPYGH